VFVKYFFVYLNAANWIVFFFCFVVLFDVSLQLRLILIYDKISIRRNSQEATDTNTINAAAVLGKDKPMKYTRTRARQPYENKRSVAKNLFYNHRQRTFSQTETLYTYMNNLNNELTAYSKRMYCLLIFSMKRCNTNTE
jgi:hypothetical protein